VKQGHSAIASSPKSPCNLHEQYEGQQPEYDLKVFNDAILGNQPIEHVPPEASNQSAPRSQKQWNEADDKGGSLSVCALQTVFHTGKSLLDIEGVCMGDPDNFARRL
jgi:hypothetical protein